MLALACTDRLPTLTDADRLSPDLVPTTIEIVLEAGAFEPYGREHESRQPAVAGGRWDAGRAARDHDVEPG